MKTSSDSKATPPSERTDRSAIARWLPRRTGAALMVALLAMLDIVSVLVMLAVLGALVVPTLARG